jgi:hypothetical protein
MAREEFERLNAAHDDSGATPEHGDDAITRVEGYACYSTTIITAPRSRQHGGVRSIFRSRVAKVGIRARLTSTSIACGAISHARGSSTPGIPPICNATPRSRTTFDGARFISIGTVRSSSERTPIMPSAVLSGCGQGIRRCSKTRGVRYRRRRGIGQAIPRPGGRRRPVQASD